MKFNSILGLIASASLAAADLTLREAAGDFKFGVAADNNKFSNEAYLNATNEFNTMVAENACKLYGIQWEQGVYDFRDCDASLKKATELGMNFRGHCLVWHSYQPEWFENLKGEDMRRALIEHITVVLTHYKGKIDTWDVVNEAIDDDSNGEGWIMRDSYIYRECPDFVDLAFKTAREVDPDVKLFYNDYNTEGVERYLGKAQSVYNFVKDMIERGVPIDGVGIQYHVHTDAYPEYETTLKILNQFADLGIEVQITEMDVDAARGKTPEEFALQAEIYADGLRACLDSKNCTGFLIWGVGDKDSWLTEGNPLLFDGDYQKKPAYYSLLNVLKDYNVESEVDADAEDLSDVETAAVDNEVSDVEVDSAEESD